MLWAVGKQIVGKRTSVPALPTALSGLKQASTPSDNSLTASQKGSKYDPTWAVFAGHLD